MKIKRQLLPVDAVPVQRVFRVDDEIEVVVQNVDLRKNGGILTKKLQKSIEQVWHRNPEWLGTLQPLALTGQNRRLATHGRRTRITNSKYVWPKLAFDKDKPRRSPSNSVCVTHPVSIEPNHVNGNTNDVNHYPVMTDNSTPKLKMTPSNEVVLVNAKTEPFSGQTDSGSFGTPTNQDSVLNGPSVADCPDREDSPCSVVEIPVEKDIPVIDIEDPASFNGSDDHSFHSDPAEQSRDVDCNVKKETETTTRTVQPKLVSAARPKKYRSELDKLYVSLKEIPWAQDWSPKTFLSRYTKPTFPKREKAKVAANTQKEKGLEKKTPLGISRNLSLQKGKVKPLLSAKDKLKLKTRIAAEAKSSVPQKSLLEHKRRKVLSTTNTVHGGFSAASANPNPSRTSKNGLAKYMKSGDKPVSATSTSMSTAAGKNVPSQKLSTDLAIKQYDASKMCKTKISPKRKFGVHYEMNGCLGLTKNGSSSSVPGKLLSGSKTVAAYNKSSPSPAQVAVSAPFRKDQPKANCPLDDPKPLVAVSPKILPFSSTPDCNGFSAVRTEAAGGVGGVLSNSSGSGSSSEGRLGNEQLLQRQLVSVLGKEPIEAKKRKLEDESLRYSVRQSECAFRYKEIAVKKHSNYIQIILVPNRTRHNGLTLEALHELREALISAKKDPTCKVLLLNSSGSIFCSGIDLASLVGQLHTPHKISQAVRSLIETLALFSKPVVAAVNGAAVGLGVTLLTYCDVVFASEKATFFTPYARLGHIPEGAMTLVLPQVVGSLVASDMLLRDRKLTAFQASIYGLVSEVIWPSQFMESVIPRVQAMANQSGQAMESTKVLLRYHQWDKLQSTLENESRLLPKQWLSMQCQQALRKALEQPGGLIDW